MGNLASLVWLDVSGNKLDETALPPHVVGVVLKPEDCKRCAKSVCGLRLPCSELISAQIVSWQGTLQRRFAEEEEARREQAELQAEVERAAAKKAKEEARSVFPRFPGCDVDGCFHRAIRIAERKAAEDKARQEAEQQSQAAQDYVITSPAPVQGVIVQLYVEYERHN